MKLHWQHIHTIQNTDDRYSTIQPAQGTTMYYQQINTNMVVCKDVCNLGGSGQKWDTKESKSMTHVVQ